jgi:hypothetical protein
MGRPRDKQQEARESRLLREVVRSIRRLDPGAPDPLRGGIRFRIVGPQPPANHWIFLSVALRDPAMTQSVDSTLGAVATPSGELFPEHPGMIAMQLDGTAWIGVADGKYRLHVWESGSGGIGNSRTPLAKNNVHLDFRGVPADISIHGQTVEVPIRSYGVQDVALLAPAADEQIDLRTASFRWSNLSETGHFRINFGHSYPIPGGVKTDSIYDAVVEGTSFSLAALPSADREKFKALQRGQTGSWSITAYAATGQKIGGSTTRSFTVAHELEAK